MTSKIFSNIGPNDLIAYRIEKGFSKALVCHNTPLDTDLTGIVSWVKTPTQAKGLAVQTTAAYTGDNCFPLSGLASEQAYDLSMAFTDDFVSANATLLRAQYDATNTVLTNIYTSTFTTVAPATISNATKLTNLTKNLGSLTVRLDITGHEDVDKLLVEVKDGTGAWVPAYTGVSAPSIDIQLSVGDFQLRLTSVVEFSNGSLDTSSPLTYGGANVVVDAELDKIVGARTLILSADSQTFSFDAAGTSIGNSSVVLTARMQNITEGSTVWTTAPANIGTDNLDGTYTITQAEFGTNTTVQVTATRNDLSDTTTIVRLQNGGSGTSPISVVLSNGNHTLPADTAGSVIELSNSGTEIHVYEGTTALAYDGVGTSVGTWKVSTVVDNVTIGAITDSGTHASVANLVGMGESVSVGSITYTVTGTLADGTPFTAAPAVQSFSKASAGVPAKGLVASATAQAFTYNEQGHFGASSITITANLKNLTGTPSWGTESSGVFAGGTASGNTYTITAAQFADNDYVTVTATLGSLTDAITIVRLTDGAKGDTGVSYTGTTEYYKLTNSSTAPTIASGSWLTTPQTPTASNQYLWNYNANSRSAGADFNSPVSLITQYVKDGKGISSIVEEYQLGTSATVAPTGTWSSTFSGAGAVSETNPYMWNKTTINYTEGAATTTTTMIAAKGDTGVSYTGTTEYYKLTNSSTAPTIASGSWLTTPQTPTASNQYLWNYNANSRSAGADFNSPVSLITQYVKDGKGISSIVEEYQLGTSATVAPTGTEWELVFADAGAVSETNPYMWNKTTINYTEGDPTVVTTMIAAKGNKGTKGDTGVSYTGTTEYYKLTNSSTAPTIASGSWLTTPQTPTASNQYLWNYNANSRSAGADFNSPVSLITQYVKDGKGISSIVEEYQLGTSATVAPTGTEWELVFADAGAVSEAKPYMWNKTTINYTEGDPTVVTTMIAAKGNKGAAGIDGFGGIPISTGLAKVGGAADFVITLDWYQGQANLGEVNITGTRFQHPDGTVRTVTPQDILTNFGDSTEGIAGQFYIIWSDTVAHTRLPSLATSALVNGNFIPVKIVNDAWVAFDNGGGTEPITFVETDCFIAAVEAKETNGGLTGLYAFTTGVAGLDGATSFTLVNTGNCTIDGNKVTKNDNTGSTWNAGVHSLETHIGASVSFRTPATNTRYIVGLNDVPSSSTSYPDMEYSIYIINTGSFDIRQNNNVIDTGTYVAGDRFSLVYDGETVSYIKNGAVFKSVAADPGQALGLDASIYTPGAVIENLTFSSAGLKGTSAITGILSNSVHNVPADSAGTVTDFTGSGTTLTVYEGTTALTYNTNPTTAGQWKAVLTSNNVTTPDIGAGGVVGDLTAMSADTGSISFNITGFRLDGKPFDSVTLVQSFSKSKQGASVTGDRGATNLSSEVPTATLSGGWDHPNNVGSAATAAADALTPGANRIGDRITLFDNTTYVETRTWNGHWVEIDQVIDGSILFPGSVTANKINVQDLFAEKITAEGSIKFDDSVNSVLIGGGTSLLDIKEGTEQVLFVGLNKTGKIGGKLLTEKSVQGKALSENALLKIKDYLGAATPAKGGSKDSTFNVTTTSHTETLAVLNHGTNTPRYSFTGFANASKFGGTIADSSITIEIQRVVGGVATTIRAAQSYPSEAGYNSEQAGDPPIWHYYWEASIEEDDLTATDNTDIQYRVVLSSISADMTPINCTFSVFEAASGGTSSYNLPTASASELGGVKIGTDLTITEGVLSVAATPDYNINELVKRDSSGHVYANAYNMAYSSDNSDVFRIITKNSSDSFMRPTTPAAFRAGVTDGSYIANSSSQSSNIHISNGSPTIYFKDTDGLGAMLHNNSDLFYILRNNANGSATWTTYTTPGEDSNSRWPLQVGLANTDHYFAIGSPNVTAGGRKVWHEGNDGSFYKTVDSSVATVGSGWVTVAYSVTGRQQGEVIVSDDDPSDHAYIQINWMRSYADSNFTVLQVGGHSNRITGVRVLYTSADITYGPCYLQVYVTVSSKYSVRINRVGDQPNFNNLVAVTPVVENTKTGYAVHGNTLTGLDSCSLAAEEGIKAGGTITAGGNITGNEFIGASLGTNAAPSASEARFGGYGILGNRGDFYVSNNAGAVHLNYNALHGSGIKLSTTSTGVTIAGTATATTFSGALSGNAATVTNGVYTSRTISTGDGLSGGGNLSANRTFTVDSTVMRNNAEQQISKTAHASGTYSCHLELHSPDSGSAQEVSLRMHQGNRFYGQIRMRSDGFHFTQGDSNTYRNIYFGTATGALAGNATSATNVYQNNNPTSTTYRLLLGNGTDANSTVYNFSDLYWDDTTSTIKGANIDGAAATSKAIYSNTGAMANNSLTYINSNGASVYNPTEDWWNKIVMGHGDPQTYYNTTLALKMTGPNTGELQTRVFSNNSWGAWNKVWSSVNDGASSGLDADLLDGYHAADFFDDTDAYRQIQSKEATGSVGWVRTPSSGLIPHAAGGGSIGSSSWKFNTGYFNTVTATTFSGALSGNASSATSASYVASGSGNPDTSASGVVSGRLEYKTCSAALSGGLPATNNANGVITVGQHSGGYTAQIGFSSDHNMYWRNNPTSVSTFKKVLDSSNYTSYAPTKTGSGASGSWGISVTGTSAGVTKSITAGTGLSGGGTLTSNITIDAVTTGSSFHLMASNGRQASGSDLNGFRESGAYGLHGSHGNQPGTGNTYDTLLVTRNSDVGSQLHIPRSAGRPMSFRGWSSNGDTFTTWRSLIDDTNTQSISGLKTFHDMNVDSIQRWRVSSADAAHQRADCRDDATSYSRLHWYGVKSDNSTTSNFRHAWYDGGAYIDVTASSNTVEFSGGNSTGLKIATTGTGSQEPRVDLLAPSNNLARMFYRNDDGGNFGFYLAGTTRLRYRNNITQWDVTANLVASGTVKGSDAGATSDIRVKENIKTIENALAKVEQLNGLTYDMMDLDGKRRAGHSAQEVEKVLPEAIDYEDDEKLGKKLSMSLSAIPALHTEAIKELSAENRELKARIARLESLVEGLING